MPKNALSKLNRNASTMPRDAAETVREIIEYNIGICSFGSILVASSMKGICAIYPSEHPDELVDELKITFRNSDIEIAVPEFEKTLARVIEFIESNEKTLGLPLDIRGTEFQQRVWQALCRIPYGRTMSYTELALKLGSGSAFRAVANACAANKLAIVIPCHRIVGNNGKVSGYRWGTKIKTHLLKKEKR